MRRFYCPELTADADSTVPLPQEVSHHLRRVLRLKEGAALELFDGNGRIAHCTLSEGGLRAKVESVRALDPPGLQIELIQSLAKGEKLDVVLQKGTELGLSRFILTASERTVVHVADAKKEVRLARWRKIVQEACRQCGQPYVPQVRATDCLADALSTATGELRLFLWEEASAPLPQLLPDRPPPSISLLVGPEGGFSAAEAEQASAAGFQALKLGPRILRTETAGLAILSILQYLYGDLSADQGAPSGILRGKDSS